MAAQLGAAAQRPPLDRVFGREKCQENPTERNQLDLLDVQDRQPFREERKAHEGSRSNEDEQISVKAANGNDSI